MLRRIARAALKNGLRRRGKRLERLFEVLGRDVRQSQQQTLGKLLENYRGTELGRHFHLAECGSVDAFRKTVPLMDYEQLRPFIDREAAGIRGVIRNERPRSFTLTSGTTDKPKLIPVYHSTLQEHRSALGYMMYQGLLAAPEVFDGRLLRLIGAPTEYVTAEGITVGSKSGQMSTNSSAFTKLLYGMPNEVFSLPPPLKYITILRYAITWDDLSLIVTPNPSTVLLLAEHLRSAWAELLADAEAGGFHQADELPEQLKRAALRLKPVKPQRLAVLQAITLPSLALVFPRLKMVSCWTSGSCGVFLKTLRQELPPRAVIRDLGYIASEVHGTLPFGPAATPGLPTAGFTFFEFVPRSAWESLESSGLAANPATLLLNELADGEQYYVFVTTADGLLRYHMNDILEVRGSQFGLPLLAFVQKGLGVTSITGEKLSEYQVLRAVDEAETELGVTGRFFICLADAPRKSYVLYFEPSDALLQTAEFAAHVDRSLCRLNLEYASKRESGRLLPPNLRLLKAGAAEAFRQYCVSRGMREGQFKFVALRNSADIGFPWERWCTEPPN